MAAPTTTVDPATATGADITIEARAAAEVTSIGGTATAPPTAPAYNPAFDVTPARLVTALITERGVLHHPDAASIAAHLA